VVRLSAAAQSRDDTVEVLILALTIRIWDSLLHPVDGADVLDNLPFEARQILGEPTDDEAGRVVGKLRQKNVPWDYAFNQFLDD
jgi:hypothetical protein